MWIIEYGGQDWSRQHILEPESLNEDVKHALKRARAHFGLTGLRGRIIRYSAHDVHWRLDRSVTILKVRWKETDNGPD